MSDPTPPEDNLTPPDASLSTLGGRYQLGDKIGGGRLTDVYHGTDSETGRAVAIKILNPDFVEDAAFAQRFVQEADLFVQELAGDEAAQEHIVQILDAGNDGDTYWVVMELVSGATLAYHERQSPGPMDPARAVDIAVSICQALNFAHSHGVIHRDVTSHNILVGSKEDGTETVKLMDVGIARPTSSTSAAQTAATLGSATYISPEIARGGEPFARSDLYSLGVVLYEMLTGRAPFSGESPVAIAMQHVRETPKRLSEIVPAIDPKLETIVLKCLAKNPADRYASADELRADLLQARPASSEAPADAGAPTEVIAPVNATAAADTMAYTSPAASKEGRPVNMKMLIGIAVAIAIVLGVVLVLVSQTSLVEVPDLVGQQSSVAQAALQEAGLTVVVIERASEIDPPGLVLAQAPPPGTKVPTGESVTLTVSKAVEVITIPNLVGLTQADAEALLLSEQLSVGLVSTTEIDGLPEGQVVAQDPAAGTTAGVGAEVNITVTIGNVPLIVPNLTCLAVNQAGNQLAEANLQMVIVGQEVNALCQPGNRVARQEPSPGSDPPIDGIVQVWTTEVEASPTGSPSPGSPTPSPTPSLLP